MKSILPIAMIVMLAGCNSMYIKPNTLDKNQTIYAKRGGYSMKRSIKERLEERGYTVRVGKAKSSQSFSGDENIDMDADVIPSQARYIFSVSERQERFVPYWCLFNGLWWWNFNVSIADQKTGEELFTWRGRGCANSSLRKLDDALDELEMKPS